MDEEENKEHDLIRSHVFHSYLNGRLASVMEEVGLERYIEDLSVRVEERSAFGYSIAVFYTETDAAINTTTELELFNTEKHFDFNRNPFDIPHFESNIKTLIESTADFFRIIYEQDRRNAGF